MIGTHGASFEQLIEDGVNGFLVPIDSPDGLLSVVEKMLALSDSQKDKIGERAANRIEALRPEITVDHLLAFYLFVINSKEGANPQFLNGTE